MSTLDLNSANTERRLRNAWHAAGCSTQHALAECGHPDDIIEDIADFLTGLRSFGNELEVDALTNDQLLSAWHFGCNRIGRAHEIAECDESLRSIMRDEVREVVRPMPETVSF